MDATCKDSLSSSELHKSANKVKNLFLPIHLWHNVVLIQKTPAILHECLETIEQLVIQCIQ